MAKKVLDCNQMFPGDIILTRNKFSMISFIIRLFTWSRYSHAAIYIGNTTICEAIASGVHTKNIFRWSEGLEGNCQVLRYPDKQIGEMAAQFSTLYHGTRYGYFDAILAGLYRYLFITFPLKASPAHMFCSRLIAVCYSSIGQNIYQLDPQLVRPKDILRSSILSKIDISFIHFKFSCNLIRNRSHSLNGHTADR